MADDVCRALEKILASCHEKARNLRDIFKNTIPGEKDMWYRRYVKVFERLGKGNKVEELMLAITQEVQIIVNQHAVNSATPQQKTELERIVEEMRSLPSSILGEESVATSFVAYGGTMNVHTGDGEHKTVTDHGRMYIGTNQTFVTNHEQLAATRMPGSELIQVGEISSGALKSATSVHKAIGNKARLKLLYGPFYESMLSWKNNVIKIPDLHKLLQGPVEHPDRVKVLNGEERHHPVSRDLDRSSACWLNLLTELGCIHSEWRSQQEHDRSYRFALTQSGLVKDAYRVPEYQHWLKATLLHSLTDVNHELVATDRVVAFPFTNEEVAVLCGIFGAGVAGCYSDGSYRARLGNATLFIRTNLNGITMAHFEGRLHATPEQWKQYRLQVLGTDVSPLHAFKTALLDKPRKRYVIFKVIEHIELAIHETITMVAGGTFNPRFPLAIANLKGELRLILGAIGVALTIYPNEAEKGEKLWLSFLQDTQRMSFKEKIERIAIGPTSKLTQRINTFLGALGEDWGTFKVRLKLCTVGDILYIFNVYDLPTYGRRYALICTMTHQLLYAISEWSTATVVAPSKDREVFEGCNFGDRIFFA
ncbi:hypothetical protein CBS11350_10236 [Aspergillus niger]|nr:hypothetical protein CBS11350_10236 [Aspergillus niger]